MLVVVLPKATSTDIGNFACFIENSLISAEVIDSLLHTYHLLCGGLYVGP